MCRRVRHRDWEGRPDRRTLRTTKLAIVDDVCCRVRVETIFWSMVGRSVVGARSPGPRHYAARLAKCWFRKDEGGIIKTADWRLLRQSVWILAETSIRMVHSAGLVPSGERDMVVARGAIVSFVVMAAS
jgi:hypothetical protein